MIYEDINKVDKNLFAFNSTVGQLNFYLPGGDAEVLIPSVFIGRSDADKILEHYTYKVSLLHRQSFGPVRRLLRRVMFLIHSFYTYFSLVAEEKSSDRTKADSRIQAWPPDPILISDTFFMLS